MERTGKPLLEMKARAQRFIDLVSHRCKRIEICGSIRREKPFPKDIDIVAQSQVDVHISQGWFGETIRTEQSLLHEALKLLIGKGIVTPRKKSDGKTMVGEAVAFVDFEGVPLDLYYATDSTWWGLVQMRTGSAAFNAMLATRALNRGMKYHGDGQGVTRNGIRLDDGKSEESIFQILGFEKFVPPQQRD